MENYLNFQTGQRIVHAKYSVCHRIGTGSHSSVYSIGLQKRGRTVIRAIKVEHDQVLSPQISTEISVLKNIQGTPNAQIGFTKLYEYGFQQDYNYIVMQLLGPNLDQFLKLSGGKLSLKTVLIMGLQMIDRIQVLHNAGYIYKDIKPENFLMGIESKSHILHLIDFGKCKRYKNKQTGKHIPYKQNTKFDGQILFSSVNTHSGTEYSRRDDIQAIIYLMIYLRKGKLPWIINKQFKTKKERELMIEQIKKKLPIQHLTFKLPLAFTDLLYYVRTLNYYEKPDYDYIRGLLHRPFVPEQDNLSMVFDWNKMDPLDFAIYSGEPKIILRNEVHKIAQQQEEQKQNKGNQKLLETNSLEQNLLNLKLQQKDKIKQQKYSEEGKRNSKKKKQNPMDLLMMMQ